MVILTLSALFSPCHFHTKEGGGEGIMVRAQPGADEGLDQPAFHPYEPFSFPGASVCWLTLSEGEPEASWPSCWVIEFIIACGLQCGWIILH